MIDRAQEIIRDCDASLVLKPSMRADYTLLGTMSAALEAIADGCHLGTPQEYAKRILEVYKTVQAHYRTKGDA